MMPFVWLASDEVVAGAAYLVANGLLTSERAEALLAYGVVEPVVEPAPVEPTP